MDKRTRFIYMGDPQCSRLGNKSVDYSQWGSLLKRAYKLAYSEQSEETQGGNSALGYDGKGLLLLGGDLVNRRDKKEAWDAFFRAGGQEFRNLHLAYPSESHGDEQKKSMINHLFASNGIDSIGLEESFYSFDFGCCHFLVLDSSVMTTRCGDAQKYIGKWIRDDLQETDKKVSFVLLHHPLFTLGSSYNDDMIAKTIKDSFLKLFLKYRVDFILCGHEHLYCRTEEIGRSQMDDDKKAASLDDRYTLVQLMGVSGTKYFDGWRLNQMEIYKKFTSVATVFAVDDKSIHLETIDADGNTIDIYDKDVNKKLKKDCSKCPKFETCQGNREIRRIDGSIMCDMLPLKDIKEMVLPENREGISVVGAGIDGIMHFTDSHIKCFLRKRIKYSVMRRGRLKCEEREGLLLSSLLKAANWDGRGTALSITNEDGVVGTLKLQDTLVANRYNCDGTFNDKVPAIILQSREDKGYREEAES
ncbi:MAG: metallophosphoesterase, partial [Bacillota bacterium]|nr:metallophosphoesterase [Bacillota bacterium]